MKPCATFLALLLGLGLCSRAVTNTPITPAPESGRDSSAKRIDGSSSMTKTTARSSTMMKLPLGSIRARARPAHILVYQAAAGYYGPGPLLSPMLRLWRQNGEPSDRHLDPSLQPPRCILFWPPSDHGADINSLRRISLAMSRRRLLSIAHLIQADRAICSGKQTRVPSHV